MIAADRLGGGITQTSLMAAVRVRATGIALVVVGLAWAVWFFLETAPPRLGFDDTDNPAVSLQFLRQHAVIYGQSGVTFIVLAVALIAAVLGVADRLSARSDSMATRITTVMGVLSAAFFIGQGTIRMSAGPLLHIDGLDRQWGEAAYIAVQMVGTHLMAGAALLTFGFWAGGVAIVGWRSRAVPRWLALLALVPAMRLVAILGPLGLGDGPDIVWLAFMASIASTPVWLLLFGLTLLRDPAPVVSP